jgi:hypothetical protein
LSFDSVNENLGTLGDRIFGDFLANVRSSVSGKIGAMHAVFSYLSSSPGFWRHTGVDWSRA